MRVLHVVAETPLSFLQHLKDITFIEKRPLRYVHTYKPYFLHCLMRVVPRFCTERLQSLVRTLELTGLDEYHALQKVASFATLVATYEKGGEPSIVVLCFCLIPPPPPNPI
jgi:DNA excision repair protein ERCC-2